MIFFLALAILLWFGGYFMTARFMSTTGLHGDELEKIISPPKWLYYLCGAPVSKHYPKGTMRVAAFGVQMGGIFLGLWLLSIVLLRTPSEINAMSLGVFMLMSYLVTAYVSKHYAANLRPQFRKKKIES